MSSFQLKVAAVYHVYKKRPLRRTRSVWVHPINAQRLTKGSFVTLYSKLRADDRKFFNYFRMSMRSFDELVGKLSDSLMQEDLHRIPISPTERLAVTLR